MNRPFIYTPPSEPLTILYEDETLLFVDKPAGLLSVPGRADDHKDCLETRVKQAFPGALLIHRLDLATSGVMVFARTAQAQRHLGLQFEKRYTKKHYQARVWGPVSPDSGTVNLPLIVDWPNRPRQKVCFETGKKAQTHWVRVKKNKHASLLNLYPVTGRSHQLRMHLMSIGHPILGDRLYAHNEAFNASERLQLHAKSLSLRHPEGGAWLTVDSPDQF